MTPSKTDRILRKLSPKKPKSFTPKRANIVSMGNAPLELPNMSGVKKFTDDHKTYEFDYGSIWVDDNTTTTDFTGTGVDNKVQYTEFASNGCTNDTTPEFAQGHIIVGKAGCHLINCKIAVENGGGVASEISFDIYKNNGVTPILNLHSHRKLAGGTGDVGSVSIVGLADLSVGDTIELWVHNEDNTQSILLSDVELSIVKLGV
jgi:hypothetical protein